LRLAFASSKVVLMVPARGTESAPGIADLSDAEYEKLRKRASLLRSAGSGSLTSAQATRLARHLGVDRATVYRWMARFRPAHTVTSLRSRQGQSLDPPRRLPRAQEAIVFDVIQDFVRKGRVDLRMVDLMAEVERRCRLERIPTPHRSSVDRRVRRTPELSVVRRGVPPPPSPRTAPGTFHVRQPLDVVQIDHTKIDLMVVDELYRYPLGRPYLTVAMDVASRAVLAFVIGFEQPNAATVALCLARASQPKGAWLGALGVDVHWPMQGLPRSLHLDNGAEFHSKALERGCAEFGVELIYRPRGRPHFGGHIERFLGTLMNRLRALPGATGHSVKGRKARRPEAEAVMTLREIEQWLALEIAGVYHATEHRGLRGGTPAGAWAAQLPGSVPIARKRDIQIAFLPGESRLVRRDGLHFQSIRYWHPIFSAWAPKRVSLFVHYDPRDLSKLYMRTKDGEVMEIGYADLRHPPISLWEQRAAGRAIRAASRGALNEQALFAAIDQKRRLVARAAQATRRIRREGTAIPSQRGSRKPGTAPARSVTLTSNLPVMLDIDVSKLTPYSGEIWNPGIKGRRS
jgi:putative transposase